MTSITLRVEGPVIAISEAGRDDADQQRHPGAEDQPGQHVAAVGIGAEQERRAGTDRGAVGRQPVGVGLERVMRGQQRREHRDQGQHDHGDHRDQRDRVPAQAGQRATAEAGLVDRRRELGRRRRRLDRRGRQLAAEERSFWRCGHQATSGASGTT
jgi:hypothetical protein